MAKYRDIAFCFRGWAYDTGKVGRPKKRVIRIGRTYTSRGAKAILNLNDTTDAGFHISPKEEDIEGVDHHVEHVQTYEAPTSEKVAKFISAVISAYKTFPRKAYLQQVVDRFRKLEQTPIESLSTPNEASMEIIRDMMEGKGALNETKADGVVRAFKEVWPHQFEDVGEDRINIDAVVELAKSLRTISFSGITIHESLYLGVIVSFCTVFSDSHAAGGYVADNLIQSAIRIARGTALAPRPASPLAQTVDGNPGVALLEALIRDNDARVEQFKAWEETGGQPYAPGGILGQLYETVQLANVVIGTQNQKAIVTVLGQVKPLVLASAFTTVSRIPNPVDANIEVFGAVLQAAVHVVAADVVDKFAIQADQESDAMDAQPTLPGLPANLVKLADKISDLYHGLGSVKEASARFAASEAIRDYGENRHSEEAPGPSTLGFPSSLSRKDAVLLRYMRRVFEKERDIPGSQDLDKELAWASRVDWKQ
ncbi:hypothetical protein Neosp_005022 [[Neocosmospora] mangrovei]